ncbi:MAG TPA: hypothetical protein QF821_01475 [Candidatus Thalassarchaeaceae archaeon]|nr:hypothetical protein [Candidatus Thalassarchaeaceae archaeon]
MGVTLVLMLLLAPMLSAVSVGQSRSTTVWSGTISLPDGYLVQSNQVLVIQAGTTVLLGDGERLGVDGRITIEGTETSPVTIDAISGDHRGIIFNSSSNSKGSVLDNLTIIDSEFGITIYGSNPVISNIRIINADNVAIDLFDSASPILRDIVIDGGGQDVHGASTTWRYGIGISSGASSAPIVQGATIGNLVTRGVNLWYNSGGLWDDISISNVTGATLAAAAGIWVEDSIPLFTDSNVSNSDNGIIVRHISDTTTRPTFLNTQVKDCQYRGVFVERFDHSNYSNLQTNAVFTGLEIRGTGGPNATTPGLGIGAAFDVNTSGVRVTDAVIEDNSIVGFRAYTIDSSTSLTNITIRNNGPESPSKPHEGAGLLFRSASWTSKGPAEIYDLVVQNSTGAGVVMAKGGAIGSNWTISDNRDNGVSFVEFHPRVNILISENNLGSGVSVIGSSNVELSNVHTSGNGIGSSDSAGLYFQDSNYVMSGSKNVSCYSCYSEGDQRGIVVRDSIDLQLISTTIEGSLDEPALDIDNSGNLFSGLVILDDIAVNSPSSNYSVRLEGVDAEISGLDLSGNGGGMFWKAKGSLPSRISNSVIWDSPSNCLNLESHTEMNADNVSLICDVLPSIDQSSVNFTHSSLSNRSGSQSSFSLNTSSHLRWISSGTILTPENSEDDVIVDVMWMIDVHTINQNLLNIPFALVNISFQQFESEVTATQPYEGMLEYGPFVGEKWTPLQGWSPTNTAYVGCDYDGVHNDSEPIQLDGDKRVYCILELSNQPPFIRWESPLDETEYSSESEILFDARESWDLDYDDLTYSWSSNIDGDIASACSMQSSNNSFFIANLNGSETCLTDGSHIITLEVCDSDGHCINETRGIELVNLPPVLTVGTSPAISSWGTLYLGETANVTIDLSGTYDPEGGDLWCWASASYESDPDPDPENPYCPTEIIRSFTGSTGESFTVSVVAWDGVNPSVSWTFSVELFNEIPEPVMEISRNGQTSADWVALTGFETFDPEGDDIRFEFISDIDGLLGSGSSPELPEWTGTLSKGTHTITMKASDTRGDHAGLWNTHSETLEVANSLPNVLISSPLTGTYTDSSELILLDSTGSGDWDLSCSELPDNGSGLLCNPGQGGSSDLVSVLWKSDQIEDPLGSGWDVSTRLPAGEHTISLTLDDGSGSVTDQIEIIVSESAPILILDSPVPNAQVYSNLPVLFDFRESVDMDGDEFSVSVTSDLDGVILDSKTTDFWYNDYLTSGTHNLTFVLTDENGMERSHVQIITVLETGPIAVISGMYDGQYLPPGNEAILSAAESYDFDDDIVLYEWRLDGNLVSDSTSLNLTLQPGSARVDLLVTDSRGATSEASINLTVGSSAPEVFDLMVSVLSVEEGVPTEVTTTVRVQDADGTTEDVRGELISGGVSDAMYFRDDGTNGDAVEGDGIWTSRFSWVVSGGSWARVEVWAIDGDLVSPGQVHTVPIVDSEKGGLESWVSSLGIPLLIITMVSLSMAGIAYRRLKMAEIAKDMQVIESWSSFDPRELDEEFDKED